MSLFTPKSKNTLTPQKSSEDFFGVQAKLNAGKSDNKHEVEADKVADTVIANRQKNTTDSFFNPSPVVQRKLASDIQKQEENQTTTKKEEQPKSTTNTTQSAISEAIIQEEKLPENENAALDPEMSADIQNPTAAVPNDANATQETPAGEEKTEEEAGIEKAPVEEGVPTEEKPAEENKKEGAEKAAKEIVSTTPRSPQEDPNFQKLTQRVGTTAKGQQAHETPEASAGSAQSAALSPANERESMAQSNQVDEMDNAEPGVFSAEAFKAKLMERIKSMQLPANQEEASDFDENNNINEVSSAATQDVANEKTKAAGPVEETAKQEPNVEAVPERAIVPLPAPPIGEQPPSVKANTAMPPQRGDNEVSKPLQDNMSEVDQQMADNEITDEQLANSNEPTFIEGLDSKAKAKENTETAPQALRQQEQGILQNAQINAKTTGQLGLQQIHQTRDASLNQVAGQQQETGTVDTAERTRIAGEINVIYENAKTDVEKILSDLDTNVNTIFTAGSEVAKAKFENYVEQKMDAYKDDRYSGIRGKARWIRDKFRGLPDEVNQFFVDGRQVYIDHMDTVITEVAQLVANKLNEAKTRIATGKQEVQDYVKALPDSLQKIGQDAAEQISTKFDELEESVNSKQDELIDSLAQQYTAGLEAVDARIEEMKAANRGLIDMVLDAIGAIIKVIIAIKNVLTNLLSAALEAIGAILSDPIGFLGNLISGIKQGFENFGTNILTHLTSGLVTWLTGSLGPMGIKIPENLFSLEGVFDLVGQILGLGWDSIRAKAVKHLGEPMVNALETSSEIFMMIKNEGIGGLWKHIKEEFSDLQETVMDAIKDMVITKVIEAGIKWILGLMSPAGAFVKAAMMIIDIVKFFIEKGSQIVELVGAFIEGIKAVASGSVVAVAKAIENALAKAIPVIIGFLAALLGVTGLTEKIQKIIGKIRKRIDKAVDKIILKAKKGFKKLVKSGKAKVKGAIAAIIQWWKYKKKFKDLNNQEHTLFFEGNESESKLMMKSVKKEVIKHINEHKKDPNTRQKAIEAETAYNNFVSARALALKGGKTEEEDKSRAENLKTTVNIVSEKLRELPGDFSPVNYPTAADITFQSDGNKPSQVISNYLTDAVPYGSPPGNGAGVTGWAEVRDTLGLTVGQDDGWIQFHLINDHLGGLGNPNNLVPTPNSVNKAYQKFENKTHALIFNTESRGGNSNAPNQKNVVWMQVKVRYYKGELNDFAKDIEAESGIYHYKPKDGKASLREKWIKDTKAVFKSNLEVPNPRLMVSGVSLAKSGQQHIKSFLDTKGITYSNTLIDEIINNRPYSDKTNFAEKITEKLINKKIDDTIAKANETQIRIKLKKLLIFFDNKLDVKH
jgi:hypothetical protein